MVAISIQTDRLQIQIQPKKVVFVKRKELNVFGEEVTLDGSHSWVLLDEAVNVGITTAS